MLPPANRVRLRQIAMWFAAANKPSENRLRVYASVQQPGLLSFVTTVWNTEPRYVSALAASVFAQDGGTSFEWFILDNGSTVPATLAALQELAQHPNVHLERVETNLGIIGGMRYGLERAAGRYILPLDSDDLLAPDCVRLLTTSILENDFPALLYTDEDKLLGRRHTAAYYKPDWDPVLFLHSCYTAHLCAIDRLLALQYGAYSDPVVEGSHDGDTFTRFHLAGHIPVHVPEVAYSWRLHPGSTSSNSSVKPVVFASQKAVIKRFLTGSERPEHYHVIKSPLFAGSPDWWIKRDRVDAPPLTTLLLCDNVTSRMPTIPSDSFPYHRIIAVPIAGGLPAIASAMSGLRGMVHLLWEKVEVRRQDWAWEALTLQELFPDAVAVGGRVFDRHSLMLSGGSMFGFGRGCDDPDRGRSAEDPGYFATAWKPHSTSAVSSQHAVFQADFLIETVSDLMSVEHASVAYLGAWAGAAARRKGKRIIYSPFIEGHASADWNARPSDLERAKFILLNADLIPETRFRSPHLGFKPSAPYRPATPAERSDYQTRLHAWAAGVVDAASPPSPACDALPTSHNLWKPRT